MIGYVERSHQLLLILLKINKYCYRIKKYQRMDFSIE
jgi:hypothetical protein